MLLSPYYSLQDIVSSKYPVIPNFILKYKFPTFEFIPKISCPIVIFHGQNDKLIKPESAIRLKKLAKTGDELYIIQNLGHNGINQNLEYQDKLKELLGR
jgi:pimeloyl-ACP methyl ester carboxylesterase